MKTIARALATMLAGSLLVSIGAAGAGASLAEKKVSDGKYARTLCTTLTGISGTEEDLVEKYNALDVNDPAAFQTEAIALTNEYIDELTAGQAKLKKLQPEGGKKVAKPFNAYFSDAITALEEAVDAFEAADPTSVAFQADVSTFQVALQLTGTTTADPFSSVKDQDLLGAFKDEKSCEDVVTIFGA